MALPINPSRTDEDQNGRDMPSAQSYLILIIESNQRTAYM